MTEKILFVDDETSIRDLVGRFLPAAGYEVTLATNGKEALERFQREPFALVLTDLKMPVMGGEELLRQIKALSPATDVILMTAYPSLESAVQALQAGAYDYVLKPFKLAELEKTVQRCLEKQRLAKNLDAERQLRQKFEERNHFKTEFLGNLSHELRTPYTSSSAIRICSWKEPTARWR